MQKLLVVLDTDPFVLAGELVASVGRIILVKAAIHTRITTVCLVPSPDYSDIAKIARAVEHLAILLIITGPGSNDRHRG